MCKSNCKREDASPKQCGEVLLDRDEGRHAAVEHRRVLPPVGSPRYLQKVAAEGTDCLEGHCEYSHIDHLVLVSQEARASRVPDTSDVVEVLIIVLLRWVWLLLGLRGLGLHFEGQHAELRELGQSQARIRHHIEVYLLDEGAGGVARSEHEGSAFTILALHFASLLQQRGPEQ